MRSAYVHIPFCKSICSYCDFCKVIYNEEWIKKYIIALQNEINELYNQEELETLYVGGGTPSCLPNYLLIELFNVLNTFKLAENYEFTFECNINDINNALLDTLSRFGVNRLSIGVESFNPKNLAFMERNHTYEETVEKIHLCREYGFKNINVDLIYGIPKQSIRSLKKDLKMLLSLEVEHISTYSLIIEDNTKIGITKMKPIGEDLDADMYEVICDTLKSKGYSHYEISNFSRVGYESRHNINYWLNNEYYGFGCGASGYIGNVRYDNTKSILNYMENKFRFKEDLLSKDDTMYNEVMLNLRMLCGINVKRFFDRYEVNIQDKYNIKPLLEEKKLIYKDGYLFINPKYIYMMNEIVIQFL